MKVRVIVGDWSSIIDIDKDLFDCGHFSIIVTQDNSTRKDFMVNKDCVKIKEVYFTNTIDEEGLWVFD